MIKIKIKRENNHINFVEVKGHANYSSFGNDIVCASVSSVVQTALLGILNVVNLKIPFEKQDGFLSFQIPNNLAEVQIVKVDAILNTMTEGLKDIQEGFKKFVKMEEI